MREQLPELPDGNVIIEPEMRDVGPAVGLVISQFVKRFPDEPITLLWGSDHLVRKEQLFRKTLRAAEALSIQYPNKIIFIGQKPRFANQNVGYIEFGKKTAEQDGIPVYSFEGFQYSPPMETAERFASDGQHSWNLGYFTTTPRFLWDLFKEFAPELFEKLEILNKAYGTDEYETRLSEIYPTIEKISFDNAILEKISKDSAAVLSVDIGWSDIGAWEAMKEALSSTEEDNVIRGKIVLEDSRDSIVQNDTEQLVVGIDLDGLVVVNTGDVLLICPKNSVPKIKKFVASLKGTEHEDLA